MTWGFSLLVFAKIFYYPTLISIFHYDTEVGSKPSKQVIIGTDNGSAMFFRYEGQSEVYRWDTNTNYAESNFQVVYRCQTCQLATHALADYSNKRMRVLESNFPDFLQSTVGCGAIQQLSIMQGCW